MVKGNHKVGYNEPETLSFSFMKMSAVNRGDGLHIKRSFGKCRTNSDSLPSESLVPTLISRRAMA